MPNVEKKCADLGPEEYRLPRCKRLSRNWSPSEQGRRETFEKKHKCHVVALDETLELAQLRAAARDSRPNKAQTSSSSFVPSVATQYPSGTDLPGTSGNFDGWYDSSLPQTQGMIRALQPQGGTSLNHIHEHGLMLTIR